MASQSPAATRQLGTKRILVVVGILSSLAVAALVGGWTYLRFSGHNMAGLEGTWRDPHDPKHCYEFRSNGDLACWYGSKSWWSRISWSATWHRDGQQITIRTDRNWDFKGQLDGGTIRGKMLIRNESGAIETEVDAVWQRDKQGAEQAAAATRDRMSALRRKLPLGGSTCWLHH